VTFSRRRPGTSELAIARLAIEILRTASRSKVILQLTYPSRVRWCRPTRRSRPATLWELLSCRSRRQDFLALPWAPGPSSTPRSPTGSRCAGISTPVLWSPASWCRSTTSPLVTYADEPYRLIPGREYLTERLSTAGQGHPGRPRSGHLWLPLSCRRCSQSASLVSG